MQPKVTIAVDYDDEKSMMTAYQLSDNLCLLRYLKKKQDITSFVRFDGVLLLVHIPSGGWVGWVKGKKNELLEMAAQLEEINNLSLSDLKLTDAQYEANDDIAKRYGLRRGPEECQ